jgi:hypothetical protein
MHGNAPKYTESLAGNPSAKGFLPISLDQGDPDCVERGGAKLLFAGHQLDPVHAGRHHRYRWRHKALLSTPFSSACLATSKESFQMCKLDGIGGLSTGLATPLARRFGHACVFEVFSVLPVKPPFERNEDIADMCDILIAAPKAATEVLRSGTWATIRHARRIGRQVVLLGLTEENKE